MHGKGSKWGETLHSPPQEEPMRRSVALTLVALVLSALPTAPVAASGSSGVWVEIRRTQFGIPHILAHDWRSLGYGTGYAFAQDDICTIAQTYVTVDAERSRFFGPDQGYLQQANGVVGKHPDSHRFFRQILDSH